MYARITNLNDPNFGEVVKVRRRYGKSGLSLEINGKHLFYLVTEVELQNLSP